jgi:undecaprenyl-diphosphatase
LIAPSTIGHAERVEPETALEPVEVHVERPRRVRSPSDVLRLLVGGVLVVLGLVLATVAEHTVGGAQADLVDAVSRLPSGLEQGVVGVAQVIAISVIAVIAVTLMVQLRWRRLGVLALGAIVAAIAMVLADHVLDLPETTRAIALNGVRVGWIDDPGFPSSAYLAASAAVVTLAGVWMSRRWKRALWGAVVVLALLRMLSSATGALDVVLAVAVGVVVGSLALVVFGAPNRAPEADALVDALRSAIPGLRSIRQLGGESESLTYRIEATGDQLMFVKLRTPDDRSADYLSRLYHSVRLRGFEVEPPYSTVQRRIEHEALVLYRATDAGAAAPRLVNIVATRDGSAMLVTDLIVGERMTHIDLDRVDRTLLDRLWHEVAVLDGAHIAHRNLALENVLVDAGDRPHLVDFDDAELAATPRERARDVAQLLVETSLIVGVDAAVDAAIDSLGAPRVAAALPLLQPLALPAPVRRRLRAGDVSLEALRAQVERRAGVTSVPLERLERVRPRTLVSIVFLTAAFYFLLPQLANLGDTWNAFRAAQWQWMPLVLLGSALTYLGAAVAFVGSVSEPVPFGAALRSRVASSFVSSFTPAGTGGMALGVRVLQRVGIDPAAASASVGVNTITGVAVHLVLLFAFVSWTGRSGVGGFSLPDSTVLLLGLAIVLALTGIALLIRKIRDLVLQPVLRALRSAGSEIAAVFRSPQRVAELIGGAALTTLAYVLALVAAVHAFGGNLSVAQIGTAFLVGTAVGNAAPTPGGLGAVEAALVAGLTGFGMASGPAVSAVLTYRLATYWLPTLPGWLVFRWMQAREEV